MKYGICKDGPPPPLTSGLVIRVADPDHVNTRPEIHISNYDDPDTAFSCAVSYVAEPGPFLVGSGLMQSRRLRLRLSAQYFSSLSSEARVVKSQN